ncbi:MAG: oligosaccharide flippase family protein [Ignavibacteria bacterium]|nr:oligosaccharide flippase family protein [Ignavibacteria bacterium]
MGIVLNQTFKNTFVSYIGLIIGYVNIILLYPAYFSIVEFGIISLLTSISFVYSQLSAIGIENTFLKFFPSFKTDDKHHNGFITFSIIVILIGFSVVTLFYILFKPLIVESFIEKSPLFLNYYFWLIPLSFFILVFNILESISRAIYKTVISVFLKEVLFRILITIGIILVGFKVISFEYFVYFYVLIHSLIFLILFIYIYRLKEYKFWSSKNTLNKKNYKELFNYGVFSFLAFSSYYISLNVDRIMLGSMVGLEMVGIFQLFVFVTTVIGFPTRALTKISVPVISDCWQKNNVSEIFNIYFKSTINLFIISSFIFICIITNFDNLIKILNKPEFNDTFFILLFLGLSFLIDATGGVNSDILSTSKKYKFDSLFNVSYLVAGILLNLIFIPLYQGVGAAIATALSILIVNIIKWNFIRRNFKMQPFNFFHFKILCIACIVFILGFILPKMENFLLDAIYRCITISILYFTLIISLKISEDINEKFYKILARVGIKK